MTDFKAEDWRENSRPANYWHKAGDKIQCDLCPRHCELKPGQKGFCQVRGNVEGEMHTYNYGISVQATIENIETEAVNHYRPGSKILSMGNVGCMMSCSYCQNWQTSQVKFLNDKNVHHYTPQDVVDLALENDIEIISWTYNDPVVWQEFVVDTSKLAHENGIKTLYKSALYIEEEPLKELIEVIDIFSVSLKGMDPKMYKKYTKGELEPVLERIKLIGESDCHLEISQLIVTDMNDNGEDAEKTANWIKENLGTSIPLHLVAYHPAFRYTKERTSNETLLELRKIVLDIGLEYCYLGNVYADNVSNTNCKSCNEKLVQRFGLSVEVKAINDEGNCSNCGTKAPIVEAKKGVSEKIELHSFNAKQSHVFNWEQEAVNSLHIIVEEEHADAFLRIERLPDGDVEFLKITGGLERLILSKSNAGESSLSIQADIESELEFLPVLDRAHFPVKNASKSSNKYLN
ncbi:MAG: AmmeMemoRadiSam system radical SAM enzyme [Salibacteraceae bacterium]